MGAPPRSAGENPDAPEHRRPEPPPAPPPPNETTTRGKRPKYVLECEQHMSPEAQAHNVRILAEAFGPGEVVILEPGMKIRPIDGKPQDKLKALCGSGFDERVRKLLIGLKGGWATMDDVRELLALAEGRQPQDELVKAHKLHRALRQEGELGYSVDGPESVRWAGRGMVYEKMPVTPEGRAGLAMPLLLPGEIDVLLDTAAWVGNAMRGTQAWKLALATAAVWTLALFTAGYRMGMLP